VAYVFKLLRIAGLVGMGIGSLRAQTPPGQPVSDTPYTIAAVPFAQLSDKNLTLDGRRALAIRRSEWKHTETKHFVIHYFSSSIAAPVSVEAEFYYRYIMNDLGNAEPATEGVASSVGKTHMYLFESRQDWVEFRTAALLESWTGAVHIDGALFVPRYPEFKWKGNALGHEISHLLVSRVVGTGLPLWLKEGYAEDVSSRGNSAFYRARGYASTPRELIPPSWMPLARLTTLQDYPPEAEVSTFYRESRALTAFLSSDGKKTQFLKFFREMGQGTDVATALDMAYGSRWSSLDMLEIEFRKHMVPN